MPDRIHVEDSRLERRYNRSSRVRQHYINRVLQSTARKKLIIAGPGTGKTHLFSAALQGKRKTLTLTFVNALVEDLSLELFGLSEVRTLHGFARAQLQKATHQSVRVHPKLSMVIHEDAEVLLDLSIDFDSMFHNRNDGDPRLHFYRTRRRYYDYYGFSDIIYASVLFFEQHPDRVPSYDLVVVDEFQDFNALEVSLIDLLATHSPILLAGDDDQAIYKTLKSASPKHIRDRHSGIVPGYSFFALPFCSRSTRVIVEAANDIINGAQRAGFFNERIRKSLNYFQCVQKDKESNSHPQLIHNYIYANQIPWFIHRQIIEITQSVRGKFKILVLSPTRNQCRRIAAALKSKGFQNVQVSERAENSPPGLLDGLKCLLLDRNCNLGWRIVAKELLPQPDFDALLRETHRKLENGEDASMVASIGRDYKNQIKQELVTLRAVRSGREVDSEQVAEVFRCFQIDPYDKAAQALRNELDEMGHEPLERGIRGMPIEVTTYQSSKGLSADFTFITYFDDQYCLRDRRAGLSDQDICSFLVALTRARRGVYLLSTDRSRTPTFLTWIKTSRICEIQSPGSRE